MQMNYEDRHNSLARKGVDNSNQIIYNNNIIWVKYLKVRNVLQSVKYVRQLFEKYP